ncbi:MAG: hypothetical protein Q9165_003550 [Trypethelium subeluteriae]
MQAFVLLFLSWAWLLNGGNISEQKLLPRQPEVKLHGGSVVSGVIDHNYSIVRQFLGIPYAQPPLADLRWEAPRPNHLPKSVNATAYGTSCTQFISTIPNLFNKDVLEFNIENLNTTGEDCLTLSVWTPQDAINLPVIVFFYGGGWYTGGQDTPYQIPTQWVERTKDLVVVVPNVEWVRDNIESFGGDPRKVTIWGQSSGAEAVDIYNYAWYKDPIVRGLIMDSGTSFIESGAGPRYSNFSYVASRVGCGNVSSSAEELACMKKVDATAIEGVIADEFNGGSMEGLAFGPSADEKVVFSNYTDRVQQGKLTKVPAIIGVNKDDGDVFAPYNANGPNQTLSRLYFLELFLCPTYKTAELRASAGVPTYRYVYAGNFSNISPKPWMGAYHQSELPLLFGTHGNYRGTSTKFEIPVSKAMQDAWRAFADNPQYGLAGQNWSQFNAHNDIARWFGDNGTVVRTGYGDLKTYNDEC